MRLAVFAQPIGQGFHAPIFGLRNGAAETLDDAFQLRGQFLDLLRAGVLARKIDVFVQRHECPFPMFFARLGAKPLEPFGKGSNALKAGTLDAGPTDYCRWALPTEAIRPSIQPPAGVERKAALYARPPGKSKADKALDLDFGGRLDDLGQPDGELGAFPDQISP